MTDTPENQWRRCNICKTPILLGGMYFRCNVSSCNRKRTGMVFCSVDCWDAHLPMMNHREAWSLQETAPNSKDAPTSAKKSLSAKAEPKEVNPKDLPTAHAPREVLVVGSRLKDYVKSRSDMKCSDKTFSPLSDHVRKICDTAIARAGAAERKTVMDRDFDTIVLDDESNTDVLVIMSRLKAYIKARGGMNTSGGVDKPISDLLRSLARQCIRNAGMAERQTVLDRDVPPV